MRIEIKNYSVDVPNDPSRDPYIMLLGPDASAGTEYRVRLNFAAPTEENTFSLEQNGDFVNVSMTRDRLQLVIDILRNEKPVFFNWSITSKIAILSTDKEPVGEGEV